MKAGIDVLIDGRMYHVSGWNVTLFKIVSNIVNFNKKVKIYVGNKAFRKMLIL